MRILVLLMVLALALPASAQDLEGSRSIWKQVEDMKAQYMQCMLELEYGGSGSACQRFDKKRQAPRFLHPFICEAYRGGRWVGVSCWDGWNDWSSP